MDFTAIFIAGLATFFNFAILKWKFEHKRYSDLFIDIGVLIAVSYLFYGSLSGMAIGMVSSALMSLYLLVYPPKINL